MWLLSGRSACSFFHRFSEKYGMPVRLLLFDPKKIRQIAVCMKLDFRLDLRGSIAPFSLLKAIKALSSLGNGQRLEILATDEQTGKELLEILDHEKFRMVKLDERKTFYKIFFEKTSS
jgi:TusA-related sulfurtransferase